MGKSKEYTVKVKKDLHAELCEGARLTGLSLAEFTDKVLRAKPRTPTATLEDRLPSVLIPDKDGGLTILGVRYKWLSMVKVFTTKDETER